MADEKITELAALGTTPDDADILPMVDDVAGTPTTKKVTVANLLAGAGGSTDVFDRFRDFINAFTYDGWGGNALAQGPYFNFSTDGSDGDEEYMEHSALYYNILESGKEVVIDFVAFYFLANTNQTIRFYFTADAGAPFSGTEDHFGFKIVNADINASCGDGSTENTADTTVNISTGFQMTHFRAVLDPGTNCKYYINNVLKNTLSSNLPDASNLRFWNISCC